MAKRYVKEGERVAIVAPHSEVCMHMQVAGRPMLAMILEGRHAAQLYRPDGTEYSAPVTPGEAGFYSDEDGFYVSVTDAVQPVYEGCARGCNDDLHVPECRFSSNWGALAIADAAWARREVAA